MLRIGEDEGGVHLSEMLATLLHRLRNGLTIAAVGFLLGLAGSKLTSGLFWGPLLRAWLGLVLALALVASLGLIARNVYIPQFFQKASVAEDPEQTTKRLNIMWELIVATPILLAIWLLTPAP